MSKARDRVDAIGAWVLLAGILAAVTFVVLALVTGDDSWLPRAWVAALVFSVPSMYFHIQRAIQDHREWEVQRAEQLGLEPGDPRVGEASMIDPIDWSKTLGRKRK